jgi:hypothetical protein
MTSRRITLLAASLVMLASTALAQPAQGPRDRQTRSLITNAMEDYQNLEIDRAVERLQIALRGCGNGSCSPQVVARVHMSLGIVAVGGQQNNESGIESMARAISLDANAEPDPLLVTPEISTAFRQAQSRGRSGGAGNTGNAGNTGSTGNSGNTGSRPSRGGGELLHTPAPEQLENTPLPVYVEANGGLSAEHVYVHFRGNGMRAFERREMTRVANGWGTEIPCANIIQGNVEYYVSAQDASGAELASAGSEGAPVQVSIVARRTAPAPALPGRMPPDTCAGGMDECPPGMTGPQCRPRGGASTRRGGLGDACTSNDECGEGMRCDGGACAATEGGSGGDEPRPSASTDRFQRFTMDVGGGVGLAYLGGGRPPYAEYRRWQFVAADGTRTTQESCGAYLCSPQVKAGFAPTYFLSALIRYNFTRRIGVGIGVRFQFDTAPWEIPPPAPTATAPNPPTTSVSNPFANLLINARLYYAFTPNGFAAQGFVASAFVGGGVGQIEPAPPLPSTTGRQPAHVLSGYGNAVLGSRLEYNLRNGFHFGAEVALQFMFPTFLFAVDVTPFVGFHI